MNINRVGCSEGQLVFCFLSNWKWTLHILISVLSDSLHIGTGNPFRSLIDMNQSSGDTFLSLFLKKKPSPLNTTFRSVPRLSVFGNRLSVTQSPCSTALSFEGIPQIKIIGGAAEDEGVLIK